MKLFSFLLMTILLSAPAFAGKEEDIAEGKRLAGLNCAKCHAQGADDKSPFDAAPPFREIARNYDDGELEDSFNDGIVVSHPAMPDWQMSNDQARQLAAFIMSLRK